MTAPNFALLVLKIIACWTLVSFIVGAAVCWLITRGKMDSHRRQHGASRSDADVPRCLSVGAEINNTGHGDHMPHAAE